MTNNLVLEFKNLFGELHCPLQREFKRDLENEKRQKEIQKICDQLKFIEIEEKPVEKIKEKTIKERKEKPTKIKLTMEEHKLKQL